MKMTKQEKLKLIHYFEFALQLETSKPVDEMDGELIKAYVDVLLDLQDMHVELSPEFIDEQVRKIFHPEDEKITAPETEKQKKKVVNKKKIWLVAACIAILVALFSVASIAFEWDVFGFLNDKFGSVHSAPVETEMEFDGSSVVVTKTTPKNYYSIEDAVKNEKINLIFPTNKTKVKIISKYTEENKDNIGISFIETELSINIILNSDLNEETKAFCNETITLNNTIYYLCIMEDIEQAQAYFVHDNNLYTVTYTDRESLIDILKNMKEVKYES